MVNKISEDENETRSERLEKAIDILVKKAKCGRRMKKKLKQLLLSYPDVLAFQG